jgi:OmcA/MtrC family decaheme c-type cytochrome
MEFAYPQSMKNCVTCHKDKLDTVLADSKFQAETCISCHSIDGIKAKMTAAVFNHGTIVANLQTTDCVLCHKTTGGAAPSFKTLHGGGYDAKIYSTTGVRYSDTFVATVDSASVAANKLTIKFSATGSLGDLQASNITPTVMVGLYGYDSKDFIVAAHGSAADKQRNLEYVWDGTASNNAKNRFTQIAKTTLAGKTTWELTADLSMWGDMIAAGTIKRAEISVLPQLTDASGLILGLNAPSRTFDLVKNAFDDGFYKDIVDVKNGCNTCHDQLATTFHSGIRGGNIKVCRTCHVVSSGGSHLELQSRSIDSYIHAIHSFQAFDVKNIDFTDPFAAMEYEHHTGTDFPRFGIMNCESCHKPGTYDVPSQAKSMPGILSGTDTLKAGSTRNIGTIPSYVTGPATRACGACHRAQKIVADDATGLAVLNAHFKANGYMVENSTGVWDSIVAKMMALFK